jgi:hypothetical protein
MKKQTYFADKCQPHVKALNAAVDLTGPPRRPHPSLGGSIVGSVVGIIAGSNVGRKHCRKHCKKFAVGSVPGSIVAG